MTLEQEIKLAAKHAAEKAAKEATEKGYEKGYKEACEKFDKKTEKAYEKGYEKAEIKGVKEKLESARNFKESGVSLEIISKCTGLSLEQIQNL